MTSAAYKYVPQTAATTFAFRSVFILLLWILYTRSYLLFAGCVDAGQHGDGEGAAGHCILRPPGPRGDQGPQSQVTQT